MMRRNFSLVFVAMIAGLFATAQPVIIGNIGGRKSFSLNGKWKYVMDPYETGQLSGAAFTANLKPKDKTDRVEYSFDDAQTLWVPGSWNSQRPELYYYEGTIWYRRVFDQPGFSKNKRYFIHIGGANYNSTVSFNGKMLGKHEGGFTPFSFEVTSLVKDSGNFVVIGVSNTRSSEGVPSKVTDWFNHGGITRDVTLVEVPQTFISDYFLALDKSTLNAKSRSINGSISLVGTTGNTSAKVAIPELNISKEVTTDNNGQALFTLSASKLQLWSPDTPKLYEVVITTGADTVREKIGFRTVETRGKQILLNGKPVFLRGICLHDENPLRADRANSMDDARLVLGWAKELGCNFLRLAHYPHQENILRLADEMGIMLWEELPLYWGIDWGNPKVLQKAKDQYAEVIHRDHNRASSIIWSIANETTPGPARNSFLKSVADHVRSLDSTRLLSAACKKDQALDGHPDDEYTVNDPIMQFLDVVSFNEYLGWYGGLPAESRKKTFSTTMEKPIIVSEFGGGALQGFYADSLTRWSEDFQAYLYRENLAMFNKIDGLAGLTPWILTDFMSPLRQLPHVQDGWNRKGLISEKGVKKKAFYILQDFYRQKKMDVVK